MPTNRTSRRSFLQSAAAALAGGSLVPYVFTANAEEATKPRSANDRFRIGAIGMRYQGTVITDKARAHGDVVAICDVDRHVREQARSSFGSTPAIFEDYRKLLDRKDVDVVMIGTPDHWHTKMLIDACRAGKDVYIEKPLTLTIDEGKQLVQGRPRDGAGRAGRLLAPQRQPLPPGRARWSARDVSASSSGSRSCWARTRPAGRFPPGPSPAT